jgi:hypothetical protein
MVQLLEGMYQQKFASCKQGQIHAESSMEESKWMSKKLNILSGNIKFFAFS